MALMLKRFLGGAHAKPLALAATVLLLGGAALATGWVAGQAQGGEVSLTGGRLQHAAAPKPPPPPAPPELQDRLQALAEAYRDPVGIAVMDVSSGWTAQVAGEAPYPQQSVSKLWVALSTLEAVDRGESSLERVVALTADDRSVFYQPLGRRIRDDRALSVSIAELLRWAITESDNAANDKLIRELGGADTVTRILADKGLEALRVGAYERDLQAQIAGMSWRPEYGRDWNFQFARERLPDAVRDTAMDAYLADPTDGASPVAIAHALAALYKGELLSPAMSKVFVDLLHETRTGPRRLKAGLPAGWTLGHKTGTGQDWRGASVGINDVGLITAPDGRVYAVAVMMRRTTRPVGSRQAFFQSVSRAVADYWRENRSPLPAGQVVAEGKAPSESGL